MRHRNLTALGLVGLLIVTGCATMQKRQWGRCAQNGALVGFIVGGGTGGILVSELGNGGDGGSTGDIAAGAAGGVVGGALLGAALGHLLCDPVKEPPAPAAPAEPPPPPPLPKRIELSADAHFDFGSAQLKPAGEEKIDEIARAMQKNAEVRILVEGYTDSVGSEPYNQRLSERRAEAVRDYMISRGIAAKRIETRGHGEASPVASNDTAEGRAQNRRVVITTEGAE
jgi:outer membrane protein OmpA-like peptidoglycan-associated protein